MICRISIRSFVFKTHWICSCVRAALSFICLSPLKWSAIRSTSSIVRGLLTEMRYLLLFSTATDLLLGIIMQPFPPIKNRLDNQFNNLQKDPFHNWRNYIHKSPFNKFQTLSRMEYTSTTRQISTHWRTFLETFNLSEFSSNVDRDLHLLCNTSSI
jgi:hypothetical protein